ncbi:MAG TPA: hypothetical protein VKQ71_12055, partial [Acidimicrobiales bacterium]|nr:hypothetical protein [Acidimicrobiales bacterium]
KESLAQLASAISGTLTAALNTGSATTAAGLRRLINAAVTAVRSGSPAVQAAMRNLANGVLDAFDRQTQAGLDRIRSNLERKLNQITQATNAQLAKVARETSRYDTAQMAPVTAEEKALQAQQRAHDLASAQQAIADAQAQLAADQASGTATPDQLAADQRAIDEAKYQLQILQEQYKIEDDKAAANAKITAEKKKQAEEDKKIREEETKKKQGARDTARSETEQWRERRKEERKQLAAYIADLRSSLEGMANDWKKYGTKSGKVYAEGLRKAEGEIRAEVAAISKLIRDGLGMDIRVTASPAAGGLPSHASGGLTKAGLAVLHEGEYVLQRSAASAIGPSGLAALNRLPHYQTGGPYPPGTKLNPTTGLPDTPAFRSSAMYVNDGGRDKNQTPVLTALVGALGSRAQAQAALRATVTFDGQELKQGQWRAPEPDSKLVGLLTAMFPSQNIVFEPGVQGQQISAGQALSRITGGLRAVSGLLATPAGLKKLAIWTSHAIHGDAAVAPPSYSGRGAPGFTGGGGTYGSQIPQFATGGVMPYDGFAYLHRNETVIPAGRGGGTLGGDHYHLHFDGIVMGDDKRRVARAFMETLRSEQSRRARKVSSLGYGTRGT